MIIAIDGPAGSGKSTIAKRIASKLEFVFLNTGNFYRGAALALLRENGSKSDGSGITIPDLSNEDEISHFVDTVPLRYQNDAFFIGTENVDPFLRTDSVEKIVAPLSGIVAVRHILNRKIREAARNMNIVCEGRDMTTVVFPDADYKFYLDASIAARTERRYLQGTSTMTREKTGEAIRKRDDIDRNKKEGKLQIAPDAMYIDTSDLTIEQVCEMILHKIHL